MSLVIHGQLFRWYTIAHRVTDFGLVSFGLVHDTGLGLLSKISLLRVHRLTLLQIHEHDLQGATTLLLVNFVDGGHARVHDVIPLGAWSSGKRRIETQVGLQGSYFSLDLYRWVIFSVNSVPFVLGI